MTGPYIVVVFYIGWNDISRIRSLGRWHVQHNEIRHFTMTLMVLKSGDDERYCTMLVPLIGL